MDKRELRRYIRGFEGPFAGSSEIFARIETISGFQHSDIVLLYSAIPGEVETAAFIEKWHRSKRIVLPKVVGDILELRLYSPDKVSVGYRGILEPSDDAAQVDPSEVGFAVIPGMAFDRAGHRLGRGKGYYDRLLPSLSCMKVAVAYGHQLVDSVPVEPHDVPVDMVITPNYSYICKDMDK